jgi:biopolymer transport protein TolR
MPKVVPGAGAPSGRSGRGRRVATSLAEINVVPLVDVMLVLLIIFMVTAPLIQRGIDVKLPQARRATQVAGERVEVTIPGTYRQSRMIYLGKEQVRAEVFQERLRQQLEGRSDKEVFLRGDSAVQYQDLMDVIDMLKAAGVQNIGMVARMPQTR